MLYKNKNNFPILLENELICSPKLIPIIENSSFSGYIISLDNLSSYCDQKLIDYDTGINQISEAHNIPECLLLISIPEHIIIESPEIIYNFDQVIVEPLNSKDKIGCLVESYINDYIHTLDEKMFSNNIYSLCEKYFEDNNVLNKVGTGLQLAGLGLAASGVHKNLKANVEVYTKKPEDWGQPYDDMAKGLHRFSGGGALLSIGTGLKLGNKLPKLYQYYKDRPKTQIAKVIAKLRKSYKKCLDQSKRMVDKNKAGIFRRIATRIAHIIDKLLLAMQRATN